MASDNQLTQRIQQHQYLRDLRSKLLHLHRLLLEAERIAYEKNYGRASGGEFLQLVIQHEQFAWLHRISELIVQIDEMLISDTPLLVEEIQNLSNYVRSLLTPSTTGDEFSQKYDAALQLNPDVIFAHADVLKLLALHSSS